MMIPASSFSQQIRYRTLYDAPDDMRKFKLNLQLFAMDVMAFGGGLEAKYEPSKNFQFDAQWRLTYPIMQPSVEDMASEKPGKLQNFAEGSVSFFFFNKVKDARPTRINLRTSGNVTTFIKVPCKKRRAFGLHGGAFYYDYLWHLKEGNSFLSSNGSEIKPPNSQYYGFRSSTVAGFAGIVTKKTKNVRIKADGYGERSYSQDNMFFLDVIVGTTLMGDIVTPNQVIDTKGTPMQPFGARMGFQWGEKHSVTRCELGLRPGPNFGVPYFLMSFAFTIVGNEKAKTN